MRKGRVPEDKGREGRRLRNIWTDNEFCTEREREREKTRKDRYRGAGVENGGKEEARNREDHRERDDF